VNRESNDDHLQVAHLILQLGRLPVRSDCWECFQPKLYHATIAGLFYALPGLSGAQQVVLAQLVNVIAGSLTLAIIWKFIAWQIQGSAQRLTIFALLAYNPALAGINAQATNDSFAILFGTLALYFAARFLAAPGPDWNPRLRDSAGMIVFTNLAALSKGTGLVIMAAILGGLALLCWQRWRAAQRVPRAAIWQASLLTA